MASTGDDARARFLHVFPALVDELVGDLCSQYDVPAETIAYVRRNLEYNVPKGKLNRGLAVRRCYAAFAKDADPASLNDADVLGWCVELLQAFFLVADDIMDASFTRRGQPCFYKLPDVGLNAINDSLMLEMMIFRVLRLRFNSHPAYPHLVQLFMDITYTTELGQLLDLTSAGPAKNDATEVAARTSNALARFNDAMLSRIYRYKTSHYSFYLPCALGMRIAGVDDPAKYETARQICLQLGHYFQAQDDFIDCFGDPAVTGKVGTDIEECTCTWLIVEALKIASPEQRAVLEDNYGRKEEVHAKAVKSIYEDLGLRAEFARFEQSSYDAIVKRIDAVSDMPTDAFRFLLAKIYKRDK